MRLVKIIVLSIAVAALPVLALADIPVGILPFKGNNAQLQSIENRMKEYLIKSGGISVIADKMLKEIMEIQEKAQSLGSSYHDISKLKTAEYLVSGIFDSGKLTITVIDVNKGTEIYSKSLNLSAGDPGHEATRVFKESRDAIFMDSSGKGREAGEEAAPYMQLLNSLVASLHLEGKHCYKHIVIYNNGKYVTPASDHKEMSQKADLFLKVIRPNLVRSKLSFLFLKSNPPWVYVNVIAEKLGKKTKHKFGIIELENGSLGIGIYEPME